MLRVTAIVATATLALLGLDALAGAAGSSPSAAAPAPAAAVIAVLGPKVSVPPGRFRRAYALCPKGYYVTGGGAYSGAITEIISSPLPNLRGWFVDGANNSPAKRPFQHRADAVCVRGTPTVAAHARAGLIRRAQADFIDSHGNRARP